jgi:hypothetical protein
MPAAIVMGALDFCDYVRGGLEMRGDCCSGGRTFGGQLHLQSIEFCKVIM